MVPILELRAAIPAGQGGRYLAPAVLGYILREHLYGTNLDLKRLSIQELRPIALSYLKAKRIPHVLGTEETAVKLASSLAESGDAVLLSPACASFDAFENFEVRGDFFRKIVNGL